LGRKGYATIGKEAEGRVFYYNGMALALSTFKEAQELRDPESLVLPEQTFLKQELQFCDKADKDAQSSLTLAIQSFADALRCLKTIANPDAYRSAETTYLTIPQFRVQGFPKDAMHHACGAHWTRLCNVLRAPGINMIEKAVLQQRADNMVTLKQCYLEKQKAAIE
jgi:hypothetical protein